MAKAKEEAVKPSEVEKMIGARKLQNLAKSAREARADAQEIAGQLGQKIANSVERDNLHRKAFRAVMAEDKMTPEKLAEFYEHLDYYRDVLGLLAKAESAPRLAFEEGEDEEEEGEINGAEEEQAASEARH